MTKNEVNLLDVSKEIFSDLDRFKQWLYSQKKNMPKNSSKIMLIVVGTRDSIKFSLVKSIHGSMDFKLISLSGNKIDAKRIKYNNINYIVDEIIKAYNKYIYFFG